MSARGLLDEHLESDDSDSGRSNSYSELRSVSGRNDYNNRDEDEDLYIPEMEMENSNSNNRDSDFPFSSRLTNRSVYNDFTTIDWVRDTARERARQKGLAQRMRTNYIGWIAKNLGDAWQGWLVVFLVGLVTGCFAGFVDIGADWLGDIKLGVCPSAFWLNKNFCCWTQKEENCDSWKDWHEFMPNISSGGKFAISYILYTLWAIALASYAAFLVKRFAPYSSGSGIPEVKTILSGFVIRKYLGLGTLLIKTLCMILAVAAGLSLGKEGPLVHVACCCGNVFSRLFEKYRYNEAKKREILSAAAAAGVSVAFGAPIGGVLFSLEEVSYYFPHKTMWRSFFCALTAAATLQYIDPFRTGRLVMFSVTYDRPWHIFEIPAFILLGLIGGLYGAFFVRANVLWNGFKQNTYIKRFPIAEVVIVTMITALCKWPIPLLRINTSSLIDILFSECSQESELFICQSENFKMTIVYLGISIFVTLFLTVFTFGIQVPAGLFIPSMASGAMFGRIIGLIFERWSRANPDAPFISSCTDMTTCINPGLYAMCGAAATLGGVTRMTVSLVVIIFELTGGLTYIVPIMIAVVVSKWVGDACGTDGIYDEHIRLRGYPFLDSKEEFSSDILVSEVMHPQANEPPMCVLTERGNTIGSLANLLKEVPYKGFPLIDSAEKRGLIGFVNRHDLIIALGNAKDSPDIRDDMRVYFNSTPATLSTRAYVDFRHLNSTPIQVTQATATETVVDMFRKLGLRYVLVTSHGELTGIITKKDLLKHIAVASKHDPNLILYS